jgi:hypothetical protein
MGDDVYDDVPEGAQTAVPEVEDERIAETGERAVAALPPLGMICSPIIYSPKAAGPGDLVGARFTGSREERVRAGKRERETARAGGATLEKRSARRP